MVLVVAMRAVLVRRRPAPMRGCGVRLGGLGHARLLFGGVGLGLSLRLGCAGLLLGRLALGVGGLGLLFRRPALALGLGAGFAGLGGVRLEGRLVLGLLLGARLLQGGLALAFGGLGLHPLAGHGLHLRRVRPLGSLPLDLLLRMRLLQGRLALGLGAANLGVMGLGVADLGVAGLQVAGLRVADLGLLRLHLGHVRRKGVLALSLDVGGALVEARPAIGLGLSRRAPRGGGVISVAPRPRGGASLRMSTAASAGMERPA